MLLFAIPLILGDLLQQCYNIFDTLIVSKVLGRDALAAVGSSFSLMTFVTSILLGLCMGSSALFSMRFGEKDEKALKEDLTASFFFISLLTIVLTIVVYLLLDSFQTLLQVPSVVWKEMKDYLFYIFLGIPAVFLYNFFASYLRALGSSVIPLLFLAVSSLLNIGLDILFVYVLPYGVKGAAWATVISQYVSGIGISIYTLTTQPISRSILSIKELKRSRIGEVLSYSSLTCIQQSVMNLGILMVQGLVNSFGPIVMAAFAAAVKIDAFAYMPVQDFGNAFSTFVAQNYGAKEKERIQKGFKGAILLSVLFCIAVSSFVVLFSKPLMTLFVDSKEVEVIQEGVRYLTIEGSFYVGIGLLFLLYGLYRALAKPGMSVILTVVSLGTRVLLAYLLSSFPSLGVIGIWMSVPIGWFLADLIGFLYYFGKRKKLLLMEIQNKKA